MLAVRKNLCYVMEQFNILYQVTVPYVKRLPGHFDGQFRGLNFRNLKSKSEEKYVDNT